MAFKRSAAKKQSLLLEKLSILLPEKKVLLPEKQLIKFQCEQSFSHFIPHAWSSVEGKRPFCDNWHIHALADHLEACVNGQIKILIINMPPRCMKSTTVDVMFPAWVWIKDPSKRFINLSYSTRLAIKENVRCRRLITSEWYQSLWADRVILRSDVNSKMRYENIEGGEKKIASIHSAVMGEGGDFLIIDDPNTDQDIDSEVTRERTNDWFDGAVSFRFDDPNSGCLIIIQQRLHQNDLTGHIIGKGYKNVVHLVLPMEYESKRKCVTIPLKNTDGKPWTDPRKEENELLWPERFTRQYIDEHMKISLGSEYNIAGQLQQRPAPVHGGIIETKYFQIWNKSFIPEFEMVLQSWDTAVSTTTTACFSACTTWGIFIDPTDETRTRNIMLINSWKGRLEQPELRHMVKKCAKDYYCRTHIGPVKETNRQPNVILVEQAANGIPLIQDLQRAGLVITPFNPRHHGYQSNTTRGNSTSKTARARLVSPLIRNKNIYLPAKPNTKNLYKFADEFLEAASLFPADDSRDLIDTMTQAFIYFLKTGEVHHVGEIPEPEIPDWKNYEYYAHNAA